MDVFEGMSPFEETVVVLDLFDKNGEKVDQSRGTKIINNSQSTYLNANYIKTAFNEEATSFADDDGHDDPFGMIIASQAP